MTHIESAIAAVRWWELKVRIARQVQSGTPSRTPWSKKASR